MKKSVQLIALVAVALLSSCSGGEKDKATAEKVDEYGNLIVEMEVE